MSQAPRKSTRATKGQPPEILDPAKGLGLASSKDTRESNAAEPLSGEADVFTTPRKDAIPASTVLDGSSPAKIVAKRPGLCAKAVARKRARAGKKAAKQGAPSSQVCTANLPHFQAGTNVIQGDCHLHAN